MANEVNINVTGRDTGAARSLDQASERSARLAQSLRRVRDVAGGILAANVIQNIGRQAMQFFGQARQAAAGLEQAVGGTRAVFGEAGAAIERFGKTSDQSVGLSERAFREATTLIGGQLKRMTGDVHFAADASLQLVQVGSDLAATYGGTTRQAVDAFAAALRGEADPAERFNLNLKVSAVNAKAVELGLAASTASVDEHARAQALLALIMEQSADAQGQFAREADTAAGAQQRANAAFEDAQAELGQRLLPLIAGASQAAANLLGAFTDLPGPIAAVVTVAGALSAGLLILAPRISETKRALDQMGISARLSGTRLGTVVRSAGRAATALGLIFAAGQALDIMIGSDLNPQLEAMALGLQQLARSGEVSGEAARILGQDLDHLSEALRVLGPEGFGPDVGNAIKRFFEGMIPPLQDMQGSMGRSREQVEALDAALAQLVEQGKAETAAAAFEQVAEKAAEQGVSVDRLRALLPQYAAALEVARSGTRDQAAAHDEAAAAVDKQIDSLKDLSDQLRAQVDPVFAYTRAQLELEEAQRAVSEAQDEHGRKSPEYQEALRREAEAALDVLHAAGALGDEFTGDLSRAQRRMLEDAGISEEAIERLAADLRQAKQDADRLDGTRAEVRVHTQFTSSGTPPHVPIGGAAVPFAAGGITGGGIAPGAEAAAQAGGPRGGADVLVGEEGPEILQLPRGTRVIPSGQSMAMLAAGEGGPGVVVNLFVQGSIRSDRDLIQLIRDEFSNGGFRGVLEGAGLQ